MKKIEIQRISKGIRITQPSEKEDKITRKFYRDLARLSKTEKSNNKTKKLNFFELILALINWKRQF